MHAENLGVVTFWVEISFRNIAPWRCKYCNCISYHIYTIKKLRKSVSKIYQTNLTMFFLPLSELACFLFWELVSIKRENCHMKAKRSILPLTKIMAYNHFWKVLLLLLILVLLIDIKLIFVA